MTEPATDRLDRIERILETIATQQQSNTSAIEALSQEMTVSNQRLQQSIEQTNHNLAALSQEMTVSNQRLQQSIEQTNHNLHAEVTNLAGFISTLAETVEDLVTALTERFKSNGSH